MDLDRTYFNSIRLNTHRGKYYDVDAVDRLLVDIRSKADLLMKEVRTSREQLAEAEKTVDALRDENTDLFLKGQALSQEILALREELRAAQSGEASLIPEEDESAAGEKDFVAEEPDQEETPAWGEEEDFYYLTEELPEPTKPEKTFEADQTDSKAIPEETEPKPEEREKESRLLLEEAEREASEILENAGAERDRILSNARLEREKTVERMERVFAMLKEISTYTIEKTEIFPKKSAGLLHR